MVHQQGTGKCLRVSKPKRVVQRGILGSEQLPSRSQNNRDRGEWAQVEVPAHTFHHRQPSSPRERAGNRVHLAVYRNSRIGAVHE